MTRAGRKRKSGPRHPGGQLKKKKPVDDRVRTSRQPHRRGLKDEQRTFEEAESPIGRLWLKGYLQTSKSEDPDQARDRYEAATKYAQTVGAYRSTIEAPRDVAGSGRGQACGADFVCKITPELCACVIFKERYDKAFEKLTKIGRRALRAVNAVVIHRETISPEEIVYLVEGLEGLRSVFGLTQRRPRSQYRNAK